MKRNYMTIVGICLIILVIAEPTRSGEYGQMPYPNGYHWLDPDGSSGYALPQIGLATVQSWVNPDGIRGTLNEVRVASVAALSGHYCVNPDGSRGTVNKPVLGLTYGLGTSK